MFVCTTDHFGLFICTSVACNLPKSVLLNTKQLIVSSSYKMKHLKGKTRSTKYATFCTPERYLSMFKVLYVCQYGCILVWLMFSVVNCKLVGEKNFKCCLNLCFSRV